MKSFLSPPEIFNTKTLCTKLLKKQIKVLVMDFFI